MAAQGIDAKADNAGVVVAVGAVWVDAFDGRNGRTEPSATVVAEFCARQDAAKSGGAQLGHQAVACHGDRNAAFATFGLALFGTGNGAAGPAPPCAFKLARFRPSKACAAVACMLLLMNVSLSLGFPDASTPVSLAAAGGTRSVFGILRLVF